MGTWQRTPFHFALMVGMTVAYVVNNKGIQDEYLSSMPALINEPMVVLVNKVCWVPILFAPSPRNLNLLLLLVRKRSETKKFKPNSQDVHSPVDWTQKSGNGQCE